MKYCANCGQKLNEGSKFCTDCGANIINLTEDKAITKSVEATSKVNPISNIKKEEINKINKRHYPKKCVSSKFQG
jgi:serine/threonine-protein kinase